MIVGLDSAQPPSADQARAARASGVKLWNGYLSEIPQRDGIYRPWSRAEFDVARIVNLRPIAFFSGWDDPVAIKQTARDWNVLPCLDVERLIRDDGPWVQGCLDASGAGLYGVQSVHVGRRAAFHIAAWYPGSNPNATYPAGWNGAAPCGWQWDNSHNEFGVTVDRGWYDDWFGVAMDWTLGVRLLYAEILGTVDIDGNDFAHWVGRYQNEANKDQVTVDFINAAKLDSRYRFGAPKPLALPAGTTFTATVK